MYAQQLHFLRNTVEPKETSNSLQGSHEQQPDFIENAASLSIPTPGPTTRVASGVGKKRLNPVEERIILPLERLDNNKSQSVEDDDNCHFLLSML